VPLNDTAASGVPLPPLVLFRNTFVITVTLLIFMPRSTGDTTAPWQTAAAEPLTRSLTRSSGRLAGSRAHGAGRVCVCGRA
jgi:hypothetical protein